MGLDSIEGDKRSSHHVGTNITMTFWEKRISLQLLWFTTAFYQAMFTLTEAIYTRPEYLVCRYAVE